VAPLPRGSSSGAAAAPDVEDDIMSSGGSLDVEQELAFSQEDVMSPLLYAPLSGGVLPNASRNELPSPPVAVRNLMELARFGQLCTMMSGMQHRRDGYPFGTVVDFAIDGAGMPILSLSPLAIHARNIIENPRCTLIVHMPGWTGLSDAMVTMFGDVRPLPRSMQAVAHDVFAAKHRTAAGHEPIVSTTSQYFRMDHIVDIYFVGGFGTVQWLSGDEYVSAQPDSVVLDRPPTRVLQELTDTFGEKARALLSPRLGGNATEPIFISYDATGAEVRVRTGGECVVHRISLPVAVQTVEQLMAAVRQALS